MSYKGRCKANYGTRSRGKSDALRIKKRNSKKSNFLKEMAKYTTLTPEGREEFAKTMGILAKGDLN
ncbi:MAG: hypothetical protein ABSB71_09390 [Candidatus Bathyarchaeia archaeon]